MATPQTYYIFDMHSQAPVVVGSREVVDDYLDKITPEARKDIFIVEAQNVFQVAEVQFTLKVAKP